jgi:hypothetical protein
MLDVTHLTGFGAFGEITAGATWSTTDKTGNITLSNGNKDADSNSTAAQGVRSATAVPNNSGKWYCEVNLLWDSGPTDGVSVFGIHNAANGFSTPSNISTVPADMYVFRDDGKLLNGGGQAPATNWNNAILNVGMLAFDTAVGAGKIWFGLNGAWEGAGDPGAGTGAQYVSVSNIAVWSIFAGNMGSGAGSGFMHCDIRSAAGEISFAPPSGFTHLA